MDFVWKQYNLSLLVARICVLCSSIFISHSSNAFQQETFASENDFVVKSLDKIGEHTIGTVFDIEQDTMGYLWLGTNRGLLRYDGANAKIINLKSNPEIQTETIRQVEITTSNRVWFATLRGLFYLDQDKVSEVLDDNGKSIRQIRNLAMDDSGNAWFSVRDNVYQVKNEKLIQKEPIGEDLFLIFSGRAGKIWIPSKTPSGIKLHYYLKGQLYDYEFTVPVNSNIQSLAETESGDIILGTVEGDLCIIKDGVLTFLERGVANTNNKRVRSIHPRNNGDIWYFKDGLKRFSNGIKHVVSRSEPGVRNLVWDVFTDRDGTLWWGSLFGLQYVLDDPYSRLTFEHGRLEERRHSLAIDQQNTIWMGTRRGLFYSDKNKLKKFKKPEQFPDRIIELASSLKEGIYATTIEGAYLLKRKDNSIKVIQKIIGQRAKLIDNPIEGELWINLMDSVNGWTVKVYTESGTFIKELVELRGLDIQFFHHGLDGRYWIGTEQGLYFHKDGQTKLFDLGPDLKTKYMRSICNGADSSIWVGTYGSGLVNIIGHEYYHYSTRNGLPANQVWMIFPAEDGGLWVNTAFNKLGTVQKIYPIVNSGTNEIALGEAYPNSRNEILLPDSGYVNKRGDELLFMNKRGIIQFKAPAKKDSEIRPNIEFVLVDDKQIKVDSLIKLEPSSRNVEIHYSVVDLLKGENQKFEYLLEGYDDTWQQVGNRTVAYYSSLPPGNYQFKLRINSSNQYFKLSSPLFLEQSEYWWNSSLTRTSGFIFLVILVAGGVRLRINAIKRQREVLRQKVDERTAEIRELNENLEIKIRQRTREVIEINEILKESEERYSYAIDAANDGIFDYDVESGKIKYSPTVYTMLGYEPYEFGETVDDFVKLMHEDDIVTHREIHKRSLSSASEDGHFQDEFRVMSKEGDVVWLRVKGKVVDFVKDQEPRRVVGTHINITAERQKNLELLDAVLKTEDSERKRIAKEIHDSLQQKLIVASMNFSAINKAIDPKNKKLGEKYDTGWQYLQDAIGESRAVAYSLMPKAIHDFGIIPAFQNLIDDLNKTYDKINFYFFHNFEMNKIDNQQIEVTLYRILQESSNNILKYAEASSVDIQLKDYDDLYMLTIEDNGIGFDQSGGTENKEGFGINGMRNRITAIDGFFEIDSRVGRGTSIIVKINKTSLK